ncbi:CsgG/HfaB family protein [Treponema sp. TIM-1]|uniref:CsgG/HfaB family protein n=1 Tax=Treponema sp. TIM-1 TaxID=2898417 RepID=UPI00398033ED
MRKIILSVFLISLFTSCATTLKITDQMVQPIIDAQLAEIEESIETGAPMAIWWCDDERFPKEPGEKEHITTISYWIQGYIEEKFVRLNKYDVVSRTQLDKIFREQEFQYSGHVDEQTMVSICKIFGAKYMIVPRITQIETFNIQVLNSETGKIIYTSNTAFKENQRIGK